MQVQNSKFKIQNFNSKFKTFKFLITLLTFNFLLFTSTNPVYALNIGEKFGFGNIASLGQGISQLVLPVFSLATTLVVIYFLWGAFNYLKSGGNKEEVAGARLMITHAIIGFLILMFIFLILPYLLFSLFGITGFQLF